MKELRFICASSKDAARIWETMQALDGVHEVVIKPYVENRRRSQENLYRSWVRMIAGATGNNPEYLHKFLAKRFLGVELVTIKTPWNGSVEEQEEILSTTRLSVKEMSHYMEHVYDFALEQGIKLPEPTA